MLTDVEREALKKWYSQDFVLEEARSLIERKKYVELEEGVHKRFIIPLGRHDQLPEFMLDEKSKPLFPSNLSPMVDEEKWQDGIEVGWQVMQEKLGFSQDELHHNIASAQEQDWQSFLDSIERRKKERGPA